MVHHSHSRGADAYYMDGAVWTRGRNVIVFIALISWLALAAGFLSNPGRFYESYLLGFLFGITICVGAIFFIMVQYLTGSAWSVPMRRFAENIMASVWVGALLFIPVYFGIHHLYHWSHADAVAHDHILQHKASYLNEKWFVIRAAIYFAVWTLLANRIYTNSTQQDKTGSLDHMHAISRWSAPGLLALFVTVTLAAFDWSMSLNPHWYSTIFGIYVFAGGGLAFMAVWTLICLGMREKGILRNTINVEHYHDLGKWMFALTVFWAYIAFSQYLLIWYANLPEETVWYAARFQGTWLWWSGLLLFGHFIIPFLILIFRGSKRSHRVLTIMGIWMLFAHWVDLYYQVMPTFYKTGVVLHWMDVVAPIAVMSVFGLAFWFRLKKHALLPIGDPRFEQGLGFINA